MLNEYTLNGIPLLNDEEPLVASEVATNIAINGLELTTGNYHISQIRHESMPRRDRDTFRIPHQDGMNPLTDFWATKAIRMNGRIRTDTEENLEIAVDTLKKTIRGENLDLVLSFGGGKRKYKVTLQNGDKIFNREHFHITYLPFTLVFECDTPFGQSAEYNYQTWYSRSLLDFTEVANNAGTEECKPIITVVIDSATAITGFTFTNVTKSESISVEQTISTGDIITIDSESLELRVNGIEVNYSGVFPRFDVGTTEFNILFTGTSISYNLTVSYLYNFL